MVYPQHWRCIGPASTFGYTKRASEPRPLGGGVLLSVPVLAILRYYGVDVIEFGPHTLVEFRNNKGRLRVAPAVQRGCGKGIRNTGVGTMECFGNSHTSNYQASCFPMRHEGKPANLWWVVEPMEENAPLPDDPRAHLDNILKNFADPMPLFCRRDRLCDTIILMECIQQEIAEALGKGQNRLLGRCCTPDVTLRRLRNGYGD